MDETSQVAVRRKDANRRVSAIARRGGRATLPGTSRRAPGSVLPRPRSHAAPGGLHIMCRGPSGVRHPSGCCGGSGALPKAPGRGAASRTPGDERNVVVLQPGSGGSWSPPACCRPALALHRGQERTQTPIGLTPDFLTHFSSAAQTGFSIEFAVTWAGTESLGQARDPAFVGGAAGRAAPAWAGAQLPPAPSPRPVPERAIAPQT